MNYESLSAEKALIWRIIHRDNLNWILENGLHCANSRNLSKNYVNIGNGDLIDKRRYRRVPVAPGGTLADYVPFYFTPFSVMMLNIHSGRGVRKRSNDEILILVSSLHRVSKMGLPFLFTNAHAYPDWTDFFDDLSYLDEIDWKLLRSRDFKRDPDDLRKLERYQAEALIHKKMPVEGLLGIVCCNEEIQKEIVMKTKKLGLDLKVIVRPNWYFS